MSIFEYDKEEEERKMRKAEFEAGEQSGIQKGIQKGIQEGIQEGKELKTKEIVNSLLQDGMGIEKIAALLKISKEHVLELAGRSKNLWKTFIKRRYKHKKWFRRRMHQNRYFNKSNRRDSKWVFRIK